MSDYICGDYDDAPPQVKKIADLMAKSAQQVSPDIFDAVHVGHYSDPTEHYVIGDNYERCNFSIVLILNDNGSGECWYTRDVLDGVDDPLKGQEYAECLARTFYG